MSRTLLTFSVKFVELPFARASLLQINRQSVLFILRGYIDLCSEIVSYNVSTIRFIETRARARGHQDTPGNWQFWCNVRERARYSFDYGELAVHIHTIGVYSSPVSQGIVCAKKRTAISTGR